MHQLNFLKSKTPLFFLSLFVVISIYIAWDSHQNLEEEKIQITRSYEAFENAIESQKHKNLRVYHKMNNKLRDLFVNDTLYQPVLEQTINHTNSLLTVLDSQTETKNYDPIKLKESIELFCDKLSKIAIEKQRVEPFKQILLNKISEQDDPLAKQAIILESKIATYTLQYDLLAALEDHIITSVPEYQTIW